MRISALSQVGIIYVMTHDSIGLGEDGPTHQPIEHLASFRAMPNMNMFQPCDGTETGTPDCIIIGTGSEVPLCIESAKVLEGEGKTVRVVSMPCWELYDAQSAEHKESVLPAACTTRVSVEAGSTMGWGKYVGASGVAIGLDRFGASAPGGKLYEEFGFTVDNVVASVKGQ